MNNLRKLIGEADKYIRPNSFISFLDNMVALAVFSCIRGLDFLTPNLITLISFLFFLFSLPCLLVHLPFLFIFFIFAAYTFDNVDGIWARYYGQTSVFGAWLDSTLDRLKDITIFTILLLSADGPLRLVAAGTIFFYLSYLILLLQERTYFFLPVEENKSATSKKLRIIAFGPAEFYVLVSLIVAIPDRYKIYPAFLLLAAIIIVAAGEFKKTWLAWQARTY
jgi:phosphatidylglycerophosphate synthase